jgi:lysozyme family protein
MALSISISTEFGVPATYWRLGEYNEVFGERGIAVMHGFFDADSTAGSPLTTRAFEISGDQYTPEMDRAAIYAFAKLSDEFSGAQDV